MPPKRGNEKAAEHTQKPQLTPAERDAACALLAAWADLRANQTAVLRRDTAPMETDMNRTPWQPLPEMARDITAELTGVEAGLTLLVIWHSHGAGRCDDSGRYLNTAAAIKARMTLSLRIAETARACAAARSRAENQC